MTARKAAILVPRSYAKLCSTWGRALPGDCFIFLAAFKEFLEAPRLRKALSAIRNKRRASIRKSFSAPKPSIPTHGASAVKSGAAVSFCNTEFRITLDGMESQNIQIAPEIIQAITREAIARGLSVDEYLRQALGVMNGMPSSDSQASARPFYETVTAEEWGREFTKWAESHGPITPGLTREDVSRERMYED